MGHDVAFRIGLAALLGLVAALGNLLGGYFVVRKDWPRKYLQYFLALGARYMLAVAFVEVIPEKAPWFSCCWDSFWCICLNTPSRRIFTLARKRTAKSSAIFTRVERCYW